MKKSLPKLVLRKEVVRALVETELVGVFGGEAQFLDQSGIKETCAALVRPINTAVLG